MKYDKIIFVDVDGPLSYGTWDEGKVKINDDLTIPYPWVQSSCEALTHVINETGAKVVISSDWKRHYTLEEIGKIFEHYGIPSVIVGGTHSRKVKLGSSLEWDRAVQIMDWVIDHNIQMRNWVAIDDLEIGKIFGDPQRGRSGKRVHSMNHVSCDGDHVAQFGGNSLKSKVGDILSWFDTSTDLNTIVMNKIIADFELEGEVSIETEGTETVRLETFFNKVGFALVPEYMIEDKTKTKNQIEEEAFKRGRRVAKQFGINF